MITTVLLDFYNTMYTAREWFELEAHEMANRVLTILMGRGEAAASSATHALVHDAYREVRQEVHATGREVSAEDGVRHALEIEDIAIPDDLNAIIDRLINEAYFPDRETSGMVESVRALSVSGYKLGIVSNALYRSFLDNSLVESGIESCFEGIFCSAEVGYYKSSPKLYTAALTALGASADEAVHVGDSLRFDVLGAKAAGLRTIWYNPEPDGECHPEPDAVVERLGQLPEKIARLSSARYQYMDAE